MGKAKAKMQDACWRLDATGLMAARGAMVPDGEPAEIDRIVADLRAAASGLFAEVDAILTPASAAMPWPRAEPFPPRIDGQQVGPRGHAIYTGWVNACGLPALARPCGLSAGGLPVGAQLIGPMRSEPALLALGERLDQGFDWPPLASTDQPS